MSMLDVLDLHFNKTHSESSDIEYRLISWGKLYLKFSEESSVILPDFPFRLFNTSARYSGIPQTLCLAFRDPIIETKKGNGTLRRTYPDEAASEFAAFLSILTRRRVFASGQTRESGLPIESPARIYPRSDAQEPQLPKEIDPNEVCRLLTQLQRLDRNIAKRFVLSMRLYHSAIEMMYSEPEFSYLFLIMSIESMASTIPLDLLKMDESELDQYLDSKYPGWRSLCDISTTEKKAEVAAMFLKKEYFVAKGFKKFITDYFPEKFWDEVQDDAKPDYGLRISYPGPHGNVVEDSPKTIEGWEKIDRAVLNRTLSDIYSARSKFVHEGMRFPANILLSHYRLVPTDISFEYPGTTTEVQKKQRKTINVPPLLTFERLVSYCLIQYLNRQGK